MKARTKKTRWLLIALLFGLLAAAGLTLTRDHARTFVAANVAPTPKPVVLPPPHVLLAATGRQHTFWTSAGAVPDDVVTAQTNSNTQQPHQTGHSGAPSDTSGTGRAGSSDAGATPAGGPSHATSPSNNPSTATTGHLPQAGAGQFAYSGYVPLDCELPAGCGATGTTASVSRQPSGTSGGMPGAHDSGSIPGQNNDPPNNNQNSDPPSNQDPPVASAPELDPATLTGAVTLLLGSLAVLRSRRRVRATR